MPAPAREGPLYERSRPSMVAFARLRRYRAVPVVCSPAELLLIRMLAPEVPMVRPDMLNSCRPVLLPVNTLAEAMIGSAWVFAVTLSTLRAVLSFERLLFVSVR